MLLNKPFLLYSVVVSNRQNNSKGKIGEKKKRKALWEYLKLFMFSYIDDVGDRCFLDILITGI